MNNHGSSLNVILQDAAELLKAGQKAEARQLLREALAMDRKNLRTWELLWQASYNVEEELKCLKQILAINPRHKDARKRFEALRPTSITDSQQLSADRPVQQAPSRQRSTSRRKKKQSAIPLLLLGFLVSAVCVSVTGFALYRGGYIPLGAPSARTATALADSAANCQVLIDKAIQASGNFCDSTNSNNVCYGNTTIQAELANNATQRFSERGDKIAVGELRRLSASPLNLENNEWGIAVFKIIANLPRSLPGETVTMVVFGNATLDNASGDSGNLESFYFSSELGQIACEKVPFDGLMITTPDGSGVRFKINDTELTLMGSASIKAIKNGDMEISVYKGSAKVVSKGEEQYVGGGQKTSVQLGGTDGNKAISAPSQPESLSGQDMNMACTMTGQFCTQSEITPVSQEQAQSQIQSEITSTSTIVVTRTLSPTPSSTIPATNTLLVLPTSTHSPGPPTKTKKPAPTETPGPTKTPGPSPTRTNTPVPPSNTPVTPSNTPITPSNTPVTPSNTPLPTATPIPPSAPICSSVSLGPLTHPANNQILMNIINSGTAVTIDSFFAYWTKSSISQKLDMLYLNDVLIWNVSDTTPPSDIPAEGKWRNGASRVIPDTTTYPFVVQFQEDQLTGYELHIYFDIGCQLIASQ